MLDYVDEWRSFQRGQGTWTVVEKFVIWSRLVFGYMCLDPFDEKGFGSMHAIYSRSDTYGNLPILSSERYRLIGVLRPKMVVRSSFLDRH